MLEFHSLIRPHWFSDRKGPACKKYAPVIPKGSVLKNFALRLVTSESPTTTTILWPFVRDYPGELVPEETSESPVEQKLKEVRPKICGALYT